MELLYKYRFHWLDLLIMALVIVTLMGFAVLAFAGVVPLEEGEEAAPWVICVVAVVVVALFFAFTPQYVAIGYDMLVVKCTLRTLQIPLRDIATIESFDSALLVTKKATRVGMSGASMTVGRYRIAGLGRVDVITTQRADRVMITTKFGYRVVINCPIDALRNHPHMLRVKGNHQ